MRLVRRVYSLLTVMGDFLDEGRSLGGGFWLDMSSSSLNIRSPGVRPPPGYALPPDAHLQKSYASLRKKRHSFLD
ncbi:hypothetical protein ACFFGV_17000 [Pontibacillus salicampi]|uniref:Uncharacterized protein n=1 Tax=Pontibacillus salicampi TaxID=1449801 RepID=A0ABV6LS94_9BACI